MAVTKLTMSGFKPSTFNKYDDFLAGNAAYDPAATFLIQRITATGGETSIDFTSIPQTYKHLQLRVLAKNSGSSTTVDAQGLFVRFNSDTTSANYAGLHGLVGNGSTVSAFGQTNQGRLNAGSVPYSLASCFSGTIIDIHDYASTTSNKTMRSFSGADGNGSGFVRLHSGLWAVTNAITSISVYQAGFDYVAGTTIALYGFTG